MKNPVHLELLPLGKTLTVERGTPLQDLLFAQGVEFPCGGRGRCQGCRLRVLSGSLPVTSEEHRLLTRRQLDGGWRLACCARADGDLKIEVAQWDAPILADESTFHFTPQEGLGIAIDLGTTTVVAQLLDLRTGQVIAIRSALNAQAQHGADIMSRIEFAMKDEGQKTLQKLARDQIVRLIQELVQSVADRADELQDVVLVGNTVMHHLFSGISLKPLSQHPFESGETGLQTFPADLLSDQLSSRSSVQFLPCLGSFVGSDILAGVLATKLHESEALVALVDLGTNGEIVVGNRERMLCASTAAGPAFEGARISMGMRAATGAISEVAVCGDEMRCHVLGSGVPRGICGSGLVDAVAAGIDLGKIHLSGRLTDGSSLPLLSPVALTQGDIRELQLAKGAIAAGLHILVQQWGAAPDALSAVYLAGAFGNYLNLSSARRIGLLDFPQQTVRPAGNTALLGAKLALFSLREQEDAYAQLCRRIRHVPLNEDPLFQDTFVDALKFPL